MVAEPRDPAKPQHVEPSTEERDHPWQRGQSEEGDLVLDHEDLSSRKLGGGQLLYAWTSSASRPRCPSMNFVSTPGTSTWRRYAAVTRIGSQLRLGHGGSQLTSVPLPLDFRCTGA